jgi:hypothetical protein
MNSLWRVRVASLVVVVAFSVVAFADFADVFIPERDDPAIQYGTRQTHDPIATLNDEIEAGRVRLQFGGEQGYLRSVLDALKVPVESQMMTFAKTSVQAPLINPGNPRALFFNDSVAVGWVPGGFVELAAQDPQQGVIFYTLEQRQTDKPQFDRRDDCLLCHDSNEAAGVPGMLLRSDFTAPSGTILRQLGSYVPDHRTPLEERWGGWYVTGNSGTIKHMGNAVVTDAKNPDSPIINQSFNLESLAGKLDTIAYPSPYSDIVALMVFEHQMHMMNLFTRISWQTRAGLARHSLTSESLDETARELVDYMLFVDEEPLANKIEGGSGFAEKFSAEGPWDTRGRSLRQLDLDHRLMKYPCSYMIYSDAFDALPPEAKNAIYKRMWQVLSGEIKGGKYARLSLEDRQAIVEILQGTKQGLPEYFRNSPKS